MSYMYDQPGSTAIVLLAAIVVMVMLAIAGVIMRMVEGQETPPIPDRNPVAIEKSNT